MLPGKGVFDAANALMFGLLIVLIARLASGAPLSSRRVLWIFFGLWLAIPDWILSTQWLTGACNYLWTAVIQLTFLKCLKSSAPAILIPLGFAAGWSNEASGAVVILLSAYFTARSKFSRRNLIGLSSAMIGYGLLMSAPGNFNRLALTHPGFQLTPSLVLEHFNDAWRNVVGGESFLFAPIVWLLITRRSLAPDVIAFSIAALLVPTAMLFSPQFASYTCLASTVFLLIASTAAFDRIEFGHSTLIGSIATLLIAIGVLSMAMSLRADYILYRQLDAQFDLIDRHRNDDCIELPSMVYDETSIELLSGRVMNAYNGRHHTAGLADDPNDYYTRAFAKYHGLNAVRLSDDEVAR